MYEFIQFLVLQLNNVISVCNSYRFNIGSVSVSFIEIMIGFVALSMIVSIAWKGAKG